MERAYRYRIEPDEDQKILIAKTFGCCRYVYNEALSRARDGLQQEEKKYYNYNQASRELTAMKKELEWLREPDSTALQSSLKNLQNAFEGIKDGKGFPHFKSRKSRQSYTSKNNKNSIRIEGKYIVLPKLGKVKFRNRKYLPKGRILSAAIIQETDGKYYCSLICTDVEIKELPKSGKAVGVDLGLKTLAITSDGQCFENQKALSREEAKLKKLQRSLSRKQHGSRRYEKNRKKLAKKHQHIRNIRQDACHKMTTELVRNYDLICIEDLHVQNMMKNHRLAKAIGDACWYEIRRQLEYKAGWYGKEIVLVDSFFPSSQTCHICGAKNPEVKDLSVRVWQCPECGTIHDRDFNAAQNLLEEGFRIHRAGTAR